MRIAALYDIHGNLPALEAVLDEVRTAAVDRIVVGGDIVVGPMTAGALDRLLDLDVPVDFIYGNAEVAVLSEMAGQAVAMPEQFREMILWDAQQLADRRPLLASWPRTLRLEVAGIGDVLFCHATPRDENEIFLKNTPEAVLRPIFDAASAALVVCGHTHMQFDRMVGRTRVVNAGSVGMPFQEPGAYWLLLGPDVRLRRTSYDLEAAAVRIRATAYPQREQFAATNVLNPPSDAIMTERFSPIAIKG